MSMTDVPEKPVAKPKKKARKRQVRTKPQATTLAYPGLTETNCCNTCGPEGCTISGQSYCAHPRKGGLHFWQMQDGAALRRLQSAQKQLATTSAEKRFS